jgi:hypothetical protein
MPGADCFALDLSGHGESAGVTLDSFGLADYADDWPVRSPSCRPNRCSSGTPWARWWSSATWRGHAAGVALLAPVPPTGTGGSASRLALLQPDFFTELPKVIAGQPTSTACG